VYLVKRLCLLVSEDTKLMVYSGRSDRFQWRSPALMEEGDHSICWRTRGQNCFCHRPNDGGSKHLWNIGKLLPDYMVLQPRRQPSSYLPHWEPEILLPQMLEIQPISTQCTNQKQINIKNVQNNKIKESRLNWSSCRIQAKWMDIKIMEVIWTMQLVELPG
jgi:hypothetical protein